MADAIRFGEYEPEDSPHEEDLVKVDFTFGIFMDGTLNNRRNTEARLAYEKRVAGRQPLSAAERTAADQYPIPRQRSTPERGAYNNWLANRPFDRDLAAAYEGADNSYENDFSNIARLYKHYEDAPGERRFRVYTEGAGSVDHGPDNQRGYALGMGHVPSENAGQPDTGIYGKVRKNLEEIFSHIRESGAKEIGKLTIDVFGFSRGAASVRHLVHDLTGAPYRPTTRNRSDTVLRDAHDYPVQESQLRDGRLPANGYLGIMLQDAGIEVDSFIVRFAGLFDTVAHHGLVQWNDVGDLGLRSISRARTVIHFTAKDEHRYNFNLNTIASVVEVGYADGGYRSPRVPLSRGLEKPLPGVHSDIGGGYREDAPEVIQELFSSTDRAAVVARKDLLIAEGWFLENQLHITAAAEGKFLLRSFRRHISNQYSFIPLHFMCELAGTLQSVPFRKSQLERDYQFTRNHYPQNVAFLTDIKGLLRAYIFEGGPELVLQPAPGPGTPPSSPAGPTSDTDAKLKTLRNHYLHWSAEGGRRVIFGIAPHKPNNEQRERDVSSG